MGAIIDRVRLQIPATYRAMAEATEWWPAGSFQVHADYVKYRLFGPAAVAELTEAAVYDPMLLDLMGKLTTLRVIPPAVNWYGHQQLSRSIETGTRTESKSYPERREELWKLYEKLRAESRADLRMLSGRHDFVIWKEGEEDVPGIRNGAVDGYSTPDPHSFGELVDPWLGYQVGFHIPWSSVT